MGDWASGGGVKIERAKEHFSALEADVTAFIAGDPFYVSSEIDEQEQLLIRRVRVLEKPPARWGAVVGDIFHNLRSSLDILWRNVWYPDGGGETDRTLTFPIHDSLHELKERYPKLPQNKRRKAAVELVFNQVKSYKGGNDPLWLLHKANAADKHRLLIPAYAQVSSTFVTSQVFHKLSPEPMALDHLVGRPIPMQESKIIFPVEDGTEIHNIDLTDPALYAPGQAEVAIVFGEGEEIKGLPIDGLVLAMIGAVEDVVQTYQSAGLLQ
jgi:hypothetical protein